jgi:Arc/MetJ family transcription regulator
LGIMKTTIDIPDRELEDAMKFTGAKTKREAVVTALTEFNQRRRMADLIKHSGTFTGMLSNEEIEALDARKEGR